MNQLNFKEKLRKVSFTKHKELKYVGLGPNEEKKDPRRKT